MNAQTATGEVRQAIVVEAPLERAFDTFTRGMAGWWPRSHHLLDVELADTVFEPRAGGHIYDRGVDGSECRWARVLVYDAPHRVVFTWDIDPQWRLETDPSRASEVEVRFHAESPTRTRVELEHRHLERHGAAWESLRDGVAGPRGWPLVLQLFAEQLGA